ncbi:hypothetical protein ACIJEF_000379 [Enterococcus faecalis]
MIYDILYTLYFLGLFFLTIILAIKFIQLIRLKKKTYPKISLRQLKKNNKRIQNYLETVDSSFKTQKKIQLSLSLVIAFFIGLLLPKFFPTITNQAMLGKEAIDYLYLGIASIFDGILLLFTRKVDTKKALILQQYLKIHPENELNIVKIKSEEKKRINKYITKCSRILFLLGIWGIIGYLFLN